MKDFLLEQGEELQSFDCYKRIYQKDSTNRDALIFLGNFMYNRGIEQLKELEMHYDSLMSPTRMQYASYEWEKNRILDTDFREAASYLEKADKQYTTPYLRKTLYSIYTRLAEIGKVWIEPFSFFSINCPLGSIPSIEALNISSPYK